MAQTGYTPILIYASGTTGNTPSAANLTSSASGAELALNYFDGRLFYKDASGNVQVLAGRGGSGVVAGSNTQVQFNNNGVFGASANMTFNGTRLTVADLADSGLTSGRVTYASTGGALVDSANLTFDGTTLTANSLTTTGTANFGGNVYLTTNATYYQSRTTGGTYIRMLGINSGNTAYVGPIDSGPVETILNASSSATNIQFYASGSEQMRLTSTGLGIGTSSPGAKLDVVGVVRGTFNSSWVDGSGSHGFEFRNAATTTKALIGGYDGSRGAYIQAVNFGTAYENLVLQPNGGNLGLGVTPSAWSGAISSAFEAKNGSSLAFGFNTLPVVYLSSNYYFDGTARYKINGTAAQYAINNNVGSHIWYTAPSGTAGNAISFTQAMTLDAGGNLGIGTTSPSDRLQVTGASSSAGSIGATITNTTANGFSSLSFSDGSQARGQIWAGNGSYASFGGAGSINYSANSGPHVWYTNYTERARITSDGNFGVGTASPSVRFEANTAVVGISTPVRISNSSATGNGRGAGLDFFGNSNTFGRIEGYWEGTNQQIRIFSTGSTIVSAGGSGGVSLAAGATSWAAISDERLKTSVTPFEGAVQKVCTLRAGTGRYLSDAESVSRSFLVAQDVQAVLPEAVDVEADEQGILSLRYTDTIPLLVAAIQELTARVAALESNP